MITPEEFSALSRVVAESQIAREENAKQVPVKVEPADTVPQKEVTRAHARTHLKTSDGAAKLLLDGGDPPKPLSILANAITLLRGYDPRWLGVLAYDQFSGAITTKKAAPWQNSAGGSWLSEDDIRCAEFLQHHKIFVSAKIASQAVQVAAQDNPYHPVREYFQRLNWDKKPRLNDWLSRYMGTELTEWARACGPRWLISAVARVMRPGCQVDHVLLLIGKQGVRKSSALRTLASDPWFTDHVSPLSSKDSRMELAGRLIVELAELDKVKGARLEQVKSFLTVRFDQYRPPYGTRVLSAPRQNIFAASTNDAQCLTDETGGRRFWPIRCGMIDTDAIAKDRNMLWGEAFARYQAGEAWWLDRRDLNELAREEQDRIYAAGVWDEMVLDWCAAPKGKVNTAILLSHPGQVLLTEILTHALDIPLSSPSVRAAQADIVRCLTHDGWTRRQIRIAGSRKWFYVKQAL